MRSKTDCGIGSGFVASAGPVRAMALLVAVCAALMLGARTAMAEPPKHASTDAAHAAAEHAGGHAEHEKADVIPTVSQGIVPGIVSLVIFTAVFGILAAMVWPKILKGLNDREEKIRSEIESAEAARRQAKDALEEYQQSLSQARAEAQKMIEQARIQQAAYAAELKAKAEAEASALRERAMKDIESAKRAALADIYTQTATLATSVASKILRREVRVDDQQRLVEESLQALQSAKN